MSASECRGPWCGDPSCESPQCWEAGADGARQERTVSFLADLSRAELDELTRTAEHAEHVAHIALVNAPLDWVTPYLRCGVAADVLALQMACYEESIARMLAGEIPT